MKTYKSIEWRAEKKALKSIDKDFQKIIAERLDQLQQWIEDEELSAMQGSSREKQEIS